MKEDQELKKCIDSVHQTMTDCRCKLRNRAMLRNLTALVPIVECRIRWSGKYLMLERFGRIYDSLGQVAEDERSAVAMNLSSSFKSTCISYEKQLKQIDRITKYLQTEYLSVSDCWTALDKLTSKVASKKSDEDSSYYQCMLGSSHISKSSSLVRDKAFLNGIIKIQRGNIDELTASEKRACKKLLIESDSEPVIPDNGTSDEDDIIKEIVSEKEKHTCQDGKYMNAKFIIGSVAIVERLWSVLRKMLPEHRKRSPQMLVEALLFLKVNSKYWSLDLVCQAMRKVKSDKIQAKLAEDQAEEDPVED